MKADEMIQKLLNENPEIGTVLRIAALARDTEARELPREMVVATEVVSIPTNPQCIV
jgi:hypothetical protein